MISFVRTQMTNEYANKQIAEYNNISASCAFLISTKIMHGLSNEEIIKKKERPVSCNTEIKSQISANVFSDNSPSQRGITSELLVGGVK